MTETNTNQSTGKGAVKSSSHVAYQVRNRDGKQGFWTRIGAAYAHADGQGCTIQLECVPLDGRITLRVAAEK
ncbi:hypothetical protein GC163_23105 [bacterium]|nr:hypothetical protein [bacterium]